MRSGPHSHSRGPRDPPVHIRAPQGSPEDAFHRLPEGVDEPHAARDRVRGSQPLTYKDGIKALEQAVAPVRRAADVAEAGLPISRGLAADLRQETARLERAIGRG